MNQTIKISVIIPTYNRSQLLIDTVQSVLDQTYQDFEIIIIDDASTDDTKSVAEQLIASDSRIRYYRQKENKRAPAARNLGLEMATGNYIQFLDSDDLLLNKKFEETVKVINGKTKYDAVITQTVIFGEQDGFWGNLPNKDSANLLLSYVKGDIKWQTAAPVWDKIFLQKIGGFKEDLWASQEYELHLRALCYSSNFFFISEPFVKVRIDYSIPAMRSVFGDKKQRISTFNALVYNYQLLEANGSLTPSLHSAFLVKIKHLLKLSVIEDHVKHTFEILNFLMYSKCSIAYKFKIAGFGYLLLALIVITGKGKNLFLKVIN